MVEAKHILLLTITAVSTYYKYQSVREGGDAFQKKKHTITHCKTFLIISTHKFKTFTWKPTDNKPWTKTTG